MSSSPTIYRDGFSQNYDRRPIRMPAVQGQMGKSYITQVQVLDILLGKAIRLLMSNMAKSLNSCLWQTRKLAIITLVEKTRTKLVSVFFFKCKGEDLHMTVSVTSRVLSALQEFEDKSCQMTVQDFCALCCLVRTLALMSYDVGLGELVVLAMASHRYSMFPCVYGPQRQRATERNILQYVLQL